MRERRNNPRFEEYRSGDENIFEGKNAVLELVRSGREIEKIMFSKGSIGSIGHILAKARENGIVTQECDKRKLDQMSITGSHQGIIAIGSTIEYKDIDDILEYAASRGEKPVVVLCDGITDPHNLGAIIRSAEVSGAHGVIIPKRRSASVNAACAKAAAGALEYLPIAKVSNIASAIDTLQKNGVFIFAADMDGEKNIYETDFSVPCGIVIGSEGNGVSHLVKEKCDQIINIPQRGNINSLNASNAAAIMLYEVLHQRYILKK